MEVKIKKDLLVKALKRISGVVSLGQRIHFQAAHYVLFETGSGDVSLTATNLSVSIRVTVEAEIVQEGRVALAGHRLLKYVELIDDDVIVIKDDKIIFGNSSSKFHSIPVDEYPEFFQEEMEFFSIDSDDLKEIVKQTAFAASTDDYRPNLAGVCLESGKSSLIAIGTNGHRLAISQAGCCENISATEDGNVIVPREAVKEIARIFNDNDSSVQVGIAGDRAVFKTSNTILVTRLIDGQFPDYRKVVPDKDREGSIIVEIDKVQLLRSLSRMKVITRDLADEKMSITKDSNRLVIESSAPGGCVSDEVEIAEGNGDAVKVLLNRSYLSDAVKAVASDTVMLEVYDEKSPLIVKGDGKSLHLIMPLVP